MRYSASEKYEIIQLVHNSDLSVRQTLVRLDLHKSTFYHWLQRYQEQGFDGLTDKKPLPKTIWNKITQEHREAIIELALDQPELSPRELAVRYTDDNAYFVSESTVYRLLKEQDLITSPAYILMTAGDRFQQPSTRVNELWQTDFTYFKIIGWGWYYLSTVLDDYSRYVVAWRLCARMSTQDVTDTLNEALSLTGLDTMKVRHKPRLLSDNGPCYVSTELASFLKEKGMTQTRGRPYHPQTQGKIERWHRSMKNQILLNHYYLPGELEECLQQFIRYYNQERYHESLNNLTPADVFYGRGQEILNQRQKIKQNTLAFRRQTHYQSMVN
jgi:putative transposase